MKLLKYLFLVLILILSMVACTDKSLSPIFFTLETERSLAEDRGLEDEMIIHEIVKVGTRYFAAGNTLYTRTVTGNWTPVAPPVAGALCNTIEIFGGNLYAGFFTTGGTGLGLYRTDPDTIDWDNSPILDSKVQNIQIGLIKAVGGNLYVATAEQNGAVYDYYLYESPDGTSYTPNDIIFDGLSPINLPITDVEDVATVFWVIAGPYLYRQSGALTATIQNAVDDPVGGEGKPLGGLLYSTSLSQLYVSGKDGKLWMWDSLVWSSEPVTEVPFTKFVDLDPVIGINDDIFVGTEGSGYFRLIGGDQTNYERRPEYNISALYNGAINSFYLDTAESALFACTFGAGLWRADYNISGEWLWVQE